VLDLYGVHQGKQEKINRTNHWWHKKLLSSVLQPRHLSILTISFHFGGLLMSRLPWEVADLEVSTR